MMKRAYLTTASMPFSHLALQLLHHSQILRSALLRLTRFEYYTFLHHSQTGNRSVKFNYRFDIILKQYPYLL